VSKFSISVTINRNPRANIILYSSFFSFFFASFASLR
jgi:hypothetical protein